jgi:hypothetical protein
VFFRRDFVQKIFQLLLPSNFSHNNKKAATLKIVDTFQDQIKKNSSDARIKCMAIFLLPQPGGRGYLDE